MWIRLLIYSLDPGTSEHRSSLLDLANSLLKSRWWRFLRSLSPRNKSPPGPKGNHLRLEKHLMSCLSTISHTYHTCCVDQLSLTYLQGLGSCNLPKLSITNASIVSRVSPAPDSLKMSLQRWLLLTLEKVEMTVLLASHSVVPLLGRHLVSQMGFINAWVPNSVWAEDMTNPCAGHLMMGRLKVCYSCSFCCNLAHGHLRQVAEEHLDWVGYLLQA